MGEVERKRKVNLKIKKKTVTYLIKKNYSVIM